jgi:2-amino-4-hydroxy-6-hydroxymethyldihydropteridine diphosphokinase
LEQYDTQLTARALLVALDVERELGRSRGERSAPRTIDIDKLAVHSWMLILQSYC